MGPESLEFLEDLLDRHEIRDGDVEFSIEWIAKEYNKQDGNWPSAMPWTFPDTPTDAQMKVALDVLHRVYETFQNGEDNGEEGHSQLDPDSHLYVIDAYEMPPWHWSTERSTFERCVSAVFNLESY